MLQVLKFGHDSGESLIPQILTPSYWDYGCSDTATLCSVLCELRATAAWQARSCRPHRGRLSTPRRGDWARGASTIAPVPGSTPPPEMAPTATWAAISRGPLLVAATNRAELTAFSGTSYNGPNATVPTAWISGPPELRSRPTSTSTSPRTALLFTGDPDGGSGGGLRFLQARVLHHECVGTADRLYIFQRQRSDRFAGDVFPGEQQLGLLDGRQREIPSIQTAPTTPTDTDHPAFAVFRDRPPAHKRAATGRSCGSGRKMRRAPQTATGTT